MKYLPRVLAVVFAIATLTYFSTYGHADEVTKTVAVAADTATQLLSSIVDGVKDLTAKYGKPATELAFETVRMQSYQALLYAVVGAAVLLAQIPLWLITIKINEGMDYNKDFFFVPTVVTSIFTSAFGIIGLSNLWDVTTWYGLYHPEVVLAADIIHKVLH